jgi:hypothetical protein
MKYKTEIFKFKQLRKLIRKPEFQRNFIWSDRKKESFIETIKKGLPVGSILLSKSDNGNYLLIDGLQRFSTLIEVQEKPFKFISMNEISSDFILSEFIYPIESAKQIFLNYNESAKIQNIELIRKIIVENYKKESEIQSSTTIIQLRIAEHLESEVSFFQDKDIKNLMVASGNVVNFLLDILNVDEIDIPTIIFDGDDEDLIYIFEKLNSGGVKLSKYDIFAARWKNTSVDVKSDKSLLQVINDKYMTSQQNEGIEIEGYDEQEFLNRGTLTLYEYAFALAKILSEKSKFLFKSKSISEVDSFGFNLLAAILGVKNQEMYTLGDKLNSLNINFVELKEKIIDVFLSVENRLEKWVQPMDGSAIPFEFKEFQVISFIVTEFRLKYELDYNEIKSISKENKNYLREFQDFLHLHYLIDNINNEWGNAGDSKLNDLALSALYQNRYINQPDPEHFTQSIDIWLLENNKQYYRNIKNLTKLFHIYLLKLNKKNSDLRSSQKLNYDHIIPVNRLKLRFDDNGIRFSLSTPCNIVLIPEYGNKAKKDKTYYEWASLHSDEITLNSESLELYMYPKAEELSFVTHNERFTIEAYSDFLNNRKNYLTNIAKKLIQR